MISGVKRVLVRAPTYLAYIWERPGWLFLLVFGRLMVARSIEAGFRARSRRTGPLPESPHVETPEAAEVIAAIRTDGVCPGLRLSDRVADGIRRFSESTPCRARDQMDLAFLPDRIGSVNRDRHKDVLVAYYFTAVEQCAEIVALRSDPRLGAIADAYVGQPTKPIRTRLWWSFPACRFDDADLHAAAQDRYHFDLNDWRTIKFFFYLTDVTSVTGPHRYIRGSHVSRPLKYQFTILQGKALASLRRHYDAADFREMTGRRGSGFAEDPFVFHTGARVKTAARLILELEFGPYDPPASYRYGLRG